MSEKLTPQNELLVTEIARVLRDSPPCGPGNPTRVADHLDNAKWESRKVKVALLAVIGAAIVAGIKWLMK